MKSSDLDKTISALRSFSYSFRSEADLQKGIASALDQSGIRYIREFVAGPYRFDFLVEPGIVIEVKIKGSLPQALTQVRKYVLRAEVCSVIIATTLPWSEGEITLSERPVVTVRLRGSF